MQWQKKSGLMPRNEELALMKYISMFLCIFNMVSLNFSKQGFPFRKAAFSKTPAKYGQAHLSICIKLAKNSMC